MVSKTKGSNRLRFIRALQEAGVEDPLVLKRDTAAGVLTDQRVAILEHLASGEEVRSVRDLARQLDRDKSIVSRDLDVLFEAGIVEFETDGRSKAPVLAHDNVFVEPIMYDGEVVSDD